MRHLRQIFLRMSVVFAAIMLCRGAVAADSDWQLVSINSRDYLSLGNIARFYQLRIEQNAVDHRWTLADSRTRLETCGNPRELYLNGVKHWLAFPVLIQDGEAHLSRFDLAKTVEPCLRPTMIGNLAPFHTVVLDAGHGGQDGGSRNLSGQEKQYTLQVIRDLQKSLEAKGFKVVLTRNDDAYIPLESRADLANHTAESVFVSVHFNSSVDASAKGFEVYAMTPWGAASTSDAAATPDQFKHMPGNDFDNAGLALAACVQHSLLGHISDGDRGVKRARFAVLRLIHAPAVLVEAGFLSNGVEGREVSDPVWRAKLADAIAIGVSSFQKVAERNETPKLMADYRNEVAPDLATSVGPIAYVVNSGFVKTLMQPVGNYRP